MSLIVSQRIYHEQPFFISNRLIQLLMGLRPSHSSNEQLLLFCTITVYLFPNIVYQFYQLYYTSDIKLYSAVNVLQKILTTLCFLFIYSTTYFKFLHLKIIYVYVKFDYEKLIDQDEWNIFEKYTKQSKMYTYLLFVIFNFYFIVIVSPCIFNILLYMFGILDNIHLILPYSINDVSNAEPLHYSLFIYQTIALYITISLASISFSLYLILVQHACCQFSVIRLKIRQPFLNMEKYGRIVWSNKKFREEFDWIVDVIKRHTRVMEFVDLLNCFSSVTYLISIFLVMLLIVLNFLSIFQLTAESANTRKFIECSVYITGSMFSIYINFYVGQRLINHSSAVFKELCQIPFYTLSVKNQKLLLFMIARSKKLCFLSIGNIFISSLEIFSKIIQKSFSFAMVYHNVR